MERLTEYSGKTPTVRGCGKNCEHAYRYCKDMEWWEDCPTLNDIIEKLAEYEDLEEQGRLLKPPCKVGDTIYEFYRQDLEDIVDLQEAISRRVVKDVLYKNGEWFIIPYNPVNAFGYLSEREFPAKEIGLSVFFTYEKAEQELMKRQKGECGT